MDALGTGVDISSIQHVLFVDLPYGALDFTQCYGRAGRSGETVDCQILLEERRVKELQTQTTDNLSASDTVMRAFILGTECQRHTLGKFMDDEALDCKELEGELCDLCPLKQATPQSRNGHQERVEYDISEQALRMERLDQFNQRAGDHRSYTEVVRVCSVILNLSSTLILPSITSPIQTAGNGLLSPQF